MSPSQVKLSIWVFMPTRMDHKTQIIGTKRHVVSTCCTIFMDWGHKSQSIGPTTLWWWICESLILHFHQQHVEWLCMWLIWVHHTQNLFPNNKCYYHVTYQGAPRTTELGTPLSGQVVEPFGFKRYVSEVKNVYFGNTSSNLKLKALVSWLTWMLLV